MIRTNRNNPNRDAQPHVQRFLPTRNLDFQYRAFFDAWHVSRAGILVPNVDGLDMRVWGGKFVNGLTVTMVAPSGTRISASEGQLAVGTVTEYDRVAYEDAGLEIPEADVRAAQICVTGLSEAAIILHKIAGYPWY